MLHLAHHAAEQLPPEAKFSWLATFTGVISLMLQGLLLALFSILVLPFYWLSYLTGHINRPQSATQATQARESDRFCTA